MMTCQHCHASANDGSVFCEQCGHELIPMRQRPTPLAPPSALGATPLPAPSTPSRHPPVPIGRAASATAAQGVAGSVVPLAIILTLPDGQRFILRGKNEYMVGRAGSGHAPPDVDLADFYGYEAGVSREHIMIHITHDGVFVQDLESANETIHNGYRLLPQQWYPLHTGVELRLGEMVLRITFERP